MRITKWRGGTIRTTILTTRRRRTVSRPCTKPTRFFVTRPCAQYDASAGGQFSSSSGRSYRYGSDDTFRGEEDDQPASATDIFAQALDAAAGFVDWLTSGAGANPKEVRYTLSLSLWQALVGGTRTFKTSEGKSIRVTLPKNVPDGYEIRSRSRSGKRIRLRFKVRKDDHFVRRGLDLDTTITIGTLQSMVGIEQQLETPYGRAAAFMIPPGTASGARLRIAGSGVQTREKSVDLVVTVQVNPPDALNPRQRAILRRAAEEAGLL